MKEILEASRENEAEVASLAIWDCGSPLYDSYELVSLSHQIERHLMALPSLGGSKRLTTKLRNPRCDGSNVHSTTDTKKTSSSIMHTLSDSVGRNLKMMVKPERGKDKRKRVTTICGFCKTFGFWKK